MPVILTTLFSGAWGLIKRALDYPLQAALIIALLACGFFYGAWQEAVDTIAKRDATIVQMEQASKGARAAQLAMNKANTDRQTQIARNADNAKTDIIDRGRAYADRMSGQAYCRKADSSAKSGLAAGGDVASDTAVILERADYDILVGNTARLVQVKAWSDDLIGQGLAVPVDGQTLPDNP